MRLGLTVVAIVVLAACGSSQPVAHAQSPAGPSPSPSLVATESPAAASPSPAPSLAAGPDCSLPFTDLSQTTGFLKFPGGELVADTRVPQGGSGTPAYDWVVKRWLPVDRRLISPDGYRYAYSELIPNPAASPGLGGPPPLGTKVHLVDLGSGADTVVYQTTNVLSAAWFGNDGIYLTEPTALVDTFVPYYVWLLDASTGTAKKVLGGKAVGPSDFFVGLGAFWIMAPDPNDPKGAKTLYRIDVQSGDQVTWYQQTTAFAQLLGLDGNGGPVVAMWSAVNGDPGKTYELPEQNSLQLVSDEGFVQMSIDVYGFWLNGNGIWFRPPGGTLQKVASERGGFILGGCG